MGVMINEEGTLKELPGESALKIDLICKHKIPSAAKRDIFFSGTANNTGVLNLDLLVSLDRYIAFLIRDTYSNNVRPNYHFCPCGFPDEGSVNNYITFIMDIYGISTKYAAFRLYARIDLNGSNKLTFYSLLRSTRSSDGSWYDYVDYSASRISLIGLYV